MASIIWKFAVVCSVAATFALFMTPADAKSTRNTRGGVSKQPVYVQPPSFGRSYNYYGGGPRGGVNFGDGRMGANYNPNQS
jgi:hypothetical protein